MNSIAEGKISKPIGSSITMDYKGYVADNNQKPISGDLNIECKIYNANHDIVWNELQTVYVIDGMLNIKLGTQKPIASDIINDYYYINLSSHEAYIYDIIPQKECQGHNQFQMSGFIVQPDNIPVGKTLKLLFTIYNATNNVQQWEYERYTEIINGKYNVQLGLSNPLECKFFNGLHYINVKAMHLKASEKLLFARTITSYNTQIHHEYNISVGQKDVLNHHYFKDMNLVHSPVSTKKKLSILDEIKNQKDEYQFYKSCPVIYNPYYFDYPRSIATDSKNKIYIADTENNCVHIFTTDGMFVTKWGRTNGLKFNKPSTIFVSQQNDVFVFNQDQVLKKCSQDGEILQEIKLEQTDIIIIDNRDIIYTYNIRSDHIDQYDINGTKLKSIEFNLVISPTTSKESCDMAIIYKNEVISIFFLIERQIKKYIVENNTLKAIPSKFPSINIGLLSNICFDQSGKTLYVLSEQGLYKVVPESESDNYLIQEVMLFGESIYYSDISLTKNGTILLAGKSYPPSVNHPYSGNTIEHYSRDGELISIYGKWGHTQGLFYAPKNIKILNDILHVFDSCNKRVQCFDIKNKFKYSGGFSINQFDNTDLLEMKEDIQMTVCSLGNYYFSLEDQESPLEHIVQKYDKSGHLQHEWSYETGYGFPSYFYDFEVENIDENTVHFYVIDDWGHYRKYIARTNTDKLVLEYQKKLDFTPGGLAYDPSDETTYISDSKNNCIKKYNKTNLVEIIGKQEDSELNNPGNIEIYKDYLFIVDKGNNRIQKWTKNGEVISIYGKFGADAGEFINPFDICINDTDELVYVSDMDNHRIQVLKKIAENEDTVKAIIIAGRYSAKDPMWPSTQSSANFAYRTLIHQGIPKDQIFYLSPSTKVDLDNNGYYDDVDEIATLEKVEQAISYETTGSDTVILFLIDHGGIETFRLNEKEILSADQLNRWLEKVSAKTVIIYDACHSGSFIPILSAGNRIILSSSKSNELASSISNGVVSFSSFFWYDIFNGNSVYQAYTNTCLKLPFQNQQHPLLEDNGDKIVDSNDGATAKNTTIGYGADNSDGAPVIALNKNLNDSLQNGELKISVNITSSNTIARAWAVIVPPKLEMSGGTIVHSPEIALNHIENNTFEAVYNEINFSGTYSVGIYAIDSQFKRASLFKHLHVNSPGEKEDKAFICVGAYVDDNHMNAIKTSVNMAIESLKSQGIKEIKLISSFVIPEIINHHLTFANLYHQLLLLADKNTKDLTLYFIGQGDYKDFYILNESKEIDKLSHKELDTLLDVVERIISGKIIFIYDSNYSGSFLSALAPEEGQKRILLFSTNASKPLQFLKNGEFSFSSIFCLYR
jgi:DNA-binding beta-propeller fold protein YncE